MIGRFRIILERLIPVREALRDVDPATILAAQFNRDVLKERRRLRAQVNDDVENRAGAAAYEFGFGRRRKLKVHPSNRAPATVEADVGLCNHGLQPVRGEFVLAERAREESALVLAALQIEGERTPKLGFNENHVHSRLEQGRGQSAATRRPSKKLDVWRLRTRVEG